MRFVELAYAVGERAVTVAFDPGLTVVHVPADEGPAWVARLLGVLGGFRDGDGARLVCVDSAGQRIGLERDEHGAATLTDLDSGDELRYSAAHLSLDGRFDWFASIGITARAAAEAMVVDRATFADVVALDIEAVEAELRETRQLLDRAARRHEAALARHRQVDGLRRRLASLDGRLRRQAAERARRQTGAADAVGGLEAELAAATVEPRRRAEAGTVLAAVAAADAWRDAGAALEEARRAVGSLRRLTPADRARALARPSDVPSDLEALAAACRAAAGRRDDLVHRLETLRRSGADDVAADVLRQLAQEVEPALADALAALAEACHPFDVVLDAARLNAAGLDAAGIAAVSAEVIAEITSRAGESAAVAGQRLVDEAESACATARDELERHLAAVGLPARQPDDVAARLETLAVRAADAAAVLAAPPCRSVADIEKALGAARALLAACTDPGPVGDDDALSAGRSQLAEELERAVWDLPDVEHLGARHSALDGQVAGLEAWLRVGRRPRRLEEVEPILAARAAQTLRVGRHREPLPLVVDAALGSTGFTDRRPLLELIARMAETTQVIYLTDDPEPPALVAGRVGSARMDPSPPGGIATVA